MPQTLLIESHYLPCLEYFVLLEQYPNIILEQHEYYQKQSYRNRTHILTATGVQALTVPIKNANGKHFFKDTLIDDSVSSENWAKKHWKTITTAYGKAPYFMYFADDFREIYENQTKKYKFLLDLNNDLMTICQKFLQKKYNISTSDSYLKNEEITEINSKNNQKNSITDVRGLIHPKKDWKENHFYKEKTYMQNFGNTFEPNLSIIDVLFCQGKQSFLIYDV